jgi:hypothetical protein
MEGAMAVAAHSSSVDELVDLLAGDIVYLAHRDRGAVDVLRLRALGWPPGIMHALLPQSLDIAAGRLGCTPSGLVREPSLPSPVGERL